MIKRRESKQTIISQQKRILLSAFIKKKIPIYENVFVGLRVLIFGCCNNVFFEYHLLLLFIQKFSMFRLYLKILWGVLFFFACRSFDEHF